ncbi:MAG: DUF3368 domain-containing protein [Hormoscilla sp. GUM202]|nr:DUF3368 domain-containing protein [Hormoscilla sp. GUM202]
MTCCTCSTIEYAYPQQFEKKLLLLDSPGMAEVETAPWIQVINVQNQNVVESFREQLDRGESEAIALGMELEADLLVIDEARGRQVAQAIGLNIIGTVGTLIKAKQRGLIPAVTPLLDELIIKGFRINIQLYQTALQRAGELDNERFSD